jgi:hypothetical protein
MLTGIEIIHRNDNTVKHGNNSHNCYPFPPLLVIFDGNDILSAAHHIILRRSRRIPLEQIYN